jgi:hypothetical protein
MPVKQILATGLALTIAATSLVTTADARNRHRHHGDAFAAGALGFAAGALLSGAFAGPRYYDDYYYDDYPSAYYYDEPGYYYAPAPRVYYRQAPPVYYRQGPGQYFDPCNVPVGSSKPANAMC